MSSRAWRWCASAVTPERGVALAKHALCLRCRGIVWAPDRGQCARSSQRQKARPPHLSRAHVHSQVRVSPMDSSVLQRARKRATLVKTMACAVACGQVRAQSARGCWSIKQDTLPEWSKGVDSISTSASCVGSNPTGVISLRWLDFALILSCGL